MHSIRFAVIADTHFSRIENYGSRDCLGAKAQLEQVIARLNEEKRLDFVLSLGDLGDGREKDEIPTVLASYRALRFPIRFLIGNHDLVHNSVEELVSLFQMPSPYYEFTLGQVRFVVLNAFEQRYGCPPDSVDGKAYRDYMKENHFRHIQPWPGIMSEGSWNWLHNVLSDAQDKGEDVILFSHVPTKDFGGIHPARLPEYERMLHFLDEFPNVRAYIAGHRHSGACTVRNGVLHKTVKSICDFPLPTACIFEVDREKITITGIGNETDYVHVFRPAPSYIRGTAPIGAFVMSNTGEIAQVGADGGFCLELPTAGIYGLKAVCDGREDVILPRIQAPTEGLRIVMTENPKRKLYTGSFENYAALRITDGNKSVPWFDAAGKESTSLYPCRSVYALTAEDAVKIRPLPHHALQKSYGLYKGDLHVHGTDEAGTVSNLQTLAFYARARHYDWLCATFPYHNDEAIYDFHSLAETLSDRDFLLSLNEEFPKMEGGHFASFGTEAAMDSVDPEKIHTLGAADHYIWKRGGVTVPLHPKESGKEFQELSLWLTEAPQKLPCIEWFPSDNVAKTEAETPWFDLLNQGFKIACFATSGHGFLSGDPHRGATYLQLPSLSSKHIAEALRQGRTTVSFDDAVLLFSIGTAKSGDVLIADGKAHRLQVRLAWKEGRRGSLRLIRNGRDLRTLPVSVPDTDIQDCLTLEIAESEPAWYTVILEDENGSYRSVASPIYFAP